MPSITGMLQPLRRDGNNDWQNASAPSLYQNEVEQALGTFAGEYKWDTTRGSKLNKLRHMSAPDSVMRDLAGAWSRECLAIELPMIAIRSVDFERDRGEDGGRHVINITVWYDIVNLKTGTIEARGQSANVSI